MKHISLAQYKEQYPDWHYFRFNVYSYKQMMSVPEWFETMLLLSNWHIVGWTDGCAMRYGAIVKTKNDAIMTKIAWNGRGLEYAGDILDEIDEEDLIDWMEGMDVDEINEEEDD
mgnify:CR=1 FL=1